MTVAGSDYARAVVTRAGRMLRDQLEDYHDHHESCKSRSRPASMALSSDPGHVTRRLAVAAARGTVTVTGGLSASEDCQRRARTCQ